MSDISCTNVALGEPSAKKNEKCTTYTKMMIGMGEHKVMSSYQCYQY